MYVCVDKFCFQLNGFNYLSCQVKRDIIEFDDSEPRLAIFHFLLLENDIHHKTFHIFPHHSTHFTS